MDRGTKEQPTIPGEGNPRRSSVHHHHPEHRHHDYPTGFPAIAGFNLWHRKWSNLSYAIFILFCNLALPCILYYVLKAHTNMSEQVLIGISSATLGISSSFDGPFRLLKLWRHRDIYGPLNDPNRWHMDFTMHLYTLALFTFAIPLAVASAIDPPLLNFFNMSTPMLVGPVGILFLISLFKVRLPCWVSSDPAGTIMKPAVFYMLEDVGAVDFRHGKDWRMSVNRRYDASPPWRDLMWYLTAYWAVGTAVYFGAVSAINWTIPFNITFGLVLGFFFIWLSVWSISSLLIVRWGLRREQAWWKNQAGLRVKNTVESGSEGGSSQV